MVDRLEPGQSVEFDHKQRIRVVGRVTTGSDEADRFPILPLDRVQETHGASGLVSGFSLVLEPGADTQSLTTSITELTQGSEVAVVDVLDVDD